MSLFNLDDLFAKSVANFGGQPGGLSQMFSSPTPSFGGLPRTALQPQAAAPAPNDGMFHGLSSMWDFNPDGSYKPASTYIAPSTEGFDPAVYMQNDNGQPIGWSGTEASRRNAIDQSYYASLAGPQATDFSNGLPQQLGSDIFGPLAQGGVYRGPNGQIGQLDQTTGNISMADEKSGLINFYDQSGKLLRSTPYAHDFGPLKGLALVAASAIGAGALGAATGAGGLGATTAAAGAGAGGITGADMAAGAGLGAGSTGAAFGGIGSGATGLGFGAGGAIPELGIGGASTFGSAGLGGLAGANAALSAAGATGASGAVPNAAPSGAPSPGVTPPNPLATPGSGLPSLGDLGNLGKIGSALGSLLGGSGQQGESSMPSLSDIIGKLGGVGGLGNLIPGLVDANQQGQAGQKMLDFLNNQQSTMQSQTSNATQQFLSRLDAQKSQMDSLYNPGTAEYNQLFDEMSRKDAAAGRNSQYGPRSVDLAAKITGIKGGLDQQFATGTAPSLNNSLNQAANNTRDFTTGVSRAYAEALNGRAGRFNSLLGGLGAINSPGGVLSNLLGQGGSSLNAGNLTSLFNNTFGGGFSGGSDSLTGLGVDGSIPQGAGFNFSNPILDANNVGTFGSGTGISFGQQGTGLNQFLPNNFNFSEWFDN